MSWRCEDVTDLIRAALFGDLIYWEARWLEDERALSVVRADMQAPCELVLDDCFQVCQTNTAQLWF